MAEATANELATVPSLNRCNESRTSGSSVLWKCADVHGNCVQLSMLVADDHRVAAALAGVLKLARVDEARHCVHAVGAYVLLSPVVADDPALRGLILDLHQCDLALRASDGLLGHFGA